MPKVYKRVEYSSEEVELIHRAARLAWNDIAFDVLTGAGMKTMRRAEVAEVVCDASRLEESLRRLKAPASLVAKALCDTELQDVAIGAFPFRVYGL